MYFSSLISHLYHEGDGTLTVLKIIFHYFSCAFQAGYTPCLYTCYVFPTIPTEQCHAPSPTLVCSLNPKGKSQITYFSPILHLLLRHFGNRNDLPSPFHQSVLTDRTTNKAVAVMPMSLYFHTLEQAHLQTISSRSVKRPSKNQE